MVNRRLWRVLCASMIVTASVGVVVYADALKEAEARFTATSSNVSAPAVVSRSEHTSASVATTTTRRIAQGIGARYRDQGAKGGVKPAGASIGTDKFDYQPGETVLITGSGFQPGELVNLEVNHLDHREDGHGPFFSVANDNGDVSDSWYVNPEDSPHSNFVLTAEGTASGLKARALFMDAPIYLIDDQGADDYPGQKDLNFLTVDYATVGKVSVTWGWDDTAWSGSNTGDACTLFDTDGNGFANYSMCVTVQNSPAVFKSMRLYSCGNTRADRCDQPNTLITPFVSTGLAQVTANADPFGKVGGPYYTANHVHGNTCDTRTGCYTADTIAALVIDLVDFPGAGAAKLINVCSYPSQIPNSAPSECVITPNSGFLTIKKVDSVTNDTSTFTFNSSAPSQSNVSSWTINGTGSQNLISFAPGTLDLKEAIPANWKLDSASCVIQSVPTTATGTPTTTAVNGAANAGVTGLSIQAGLETICTFTDSKQLGSIKIVKNSVGGDAKFTFNPTGFNSNASFDLTTSSGTAQQTFQGLAPGSGYSITESATAGFVANGAVCDSGSTIAAITVVAGQTTTCTFTNNKESTLKLVKHVTNDNGGTAMVANFTLKADATTFVSGTSQVVTPATYALSESGPSGYTASAWSCTGFVSGSVTGSSVTIGIGENVTCEITNDDNAATLIVIKHVINDNGGAATASQFTMTINDVTASGGNSFAGAESPGTTKTLTTVGSYSVSESGPLGYTATYSTDCSGTIALGETKTCTVTNDDAKASPGGSTVQKAILHDRLNITTGIRRGVGEGPITVTFRVYSDPSCSTQVGIDETVNFVFDAPTTTAPSGHASTSTGVEVLLGGTYKWKATFSGNTFNDGFTTGCGSEVTTLAFTYPQ
jgi:hypothetical protein